jgi:hypothetical protein
MDRRHRRAQELTRAQPPATLARPALGGSSWGGGVGHGGLSPGLTEAQEAVEWRRDGGEGGGG